MKNWKVIIEHGGKILTIDLEAKSFADAYVEIELRYPGCIVKSISEVRT